VGVLFVSGLALHMVLRRRNSGHVS
jgi:hypothetical protein